jgi:penicillin-binding protein 1A
LKLAAGYAAFANGGYKVTPYFIDRVVSANGEVLYESKPLLCPECNTPPETPLPPAPPDPELVSDITELYPKQRAAPRVISPQNAFLIADMLVDVVRFGSGNRARRELVRDDLAGKTGTTNEGRDTWFVGFNADVVGAAWVGFDQFRPLGGNEQGGRTAIPMWIDFMREALAGMPERLPKRPPGIVEYRINPETGRIAGDGTTNTIFEKFDVDHLPEREPSGFAAPLDRQQPGGGTRSSPIF